MKLHTPSASPWHSWFTTNYGWSSSRDLGDIKHFDTPVWSALVSGLQSFRDTTFVTVGSGNSTSFWLDLWLDDITLADRFPALFSHSRRKNASVARVLSMDNLFLDLQPRLSSAASSELAALTSCLSSTTLDPFVADFHFCRNSVSSPFSTAVSYSISFSHLEDDPFATHIWRNFAPSRCRSFLWLTHQHKLNTHVRLRSRRANNTGHCHFCAADEDVPHLFLYCPRAQSFWCLLGVDSSSIPSIERLWSTPFPWACYPQPENALNHYHLYFVECLEVQELQGV